LGQFKTRVKRAFERSTGSHKRIFSNFECRKNCYLNLRVPKNFVCNSLVKHLFFTRRICAIAALVRQIFLLVKKSITLLTCCINNYFLLILLEIYVFKFAAFASVKRSPFESTSTAFLNGIDCSLYFFVTMTILIIVIAIFLSDDARNSVSLTVHLCLIVQENFEYFFFFNF
jgi:hypothetical protein